jgi:uncharacterized protein (DUF433 family)
LAQGKEIDVAIKTEYPYIVLDERGMPVIEGTTLKIFELVVEKLAYGWSPEELHLQHPYLTLGQIHAALAYYWDHAEELDREIAARLKEVNALRERAKAQPSPLVAKLKAQGLL